MYKLISEDLAEREFTSLRRGFVQACEDQPEALWEGRFLFGGYPVGIHIAGRELRDQVVQSFLHLQLHPPGAGPPRLEIQLWGPVEKGIAADANTTALARRSKPVVFTTPDGRFVLERSITASLALDRMRPAIAGRFLSSESQQVYERYKPMSRLLVEWFNDRNLPVLHAGLVARPAGGVLLAGGSGSGKSTTALLCLQSGFEFLGEDYVAVERLHDGTFRGHSMYTSVFLQRDQMAWFPDLRTDAVGTVDDDKLAVNLAQAFPQRLKRTVPIRALAICKIGAQQSASIRPATSIEALRILGLSSLMQIPNRGQRSLDSLSSLIERVPSFWLHLGQDLTSIPRCVDQILLEVVK